VTEWVPEVNVDVEKVATPEASVAVPITAPPSRNCTLPVAVEGVTVAVSVTAWPGFEGLVLEVIATDEDAFTICGQLDVLALI